MDTTYQVIAQRQFRDTLADGRVGDVVEVTFRTSDGVTGQVTVPLDVFDEDVVRALIESRVTDHARVARLQGIIE